MVPEPVVKEKIVYVEKKEPKKKAAGFSGVQKTPDNGTYRGPIVRGKATGEGTISWPDGSVYTGDVIDGMANGLGSLVDKDGNVFEGVFVEGKQQGPGSAEYSDGRPSYRGRFVDGEPEKSRK